MKKRFISVIVAGGIIAAGAGTAMATAAGSTGSNYNPAVSSRILDTRTSSGAIGAGKTLVVTATGVPAGATAATVNLTETGPTGVGYLLAYPDGATRPAQGSSVNFGPGQTEANEVTVPVTDGKIDVYNGSTGSVQLVVDLEGWYTPTAAPYTPPAGVSKDLGSLSSVATGGSAKTGSTQVGTVTLTAGTYQVSVNAKATPVLLESGAQVFPQFFVYNGALDPTQTTWWANNLFNVGSGALESGANNQIDSYFSGNGIVTVPAAGETLYVYAFGYDSDRGAGSYTLDDLSVTAVPVSQ